MDEVIGEVTETPIRFDIFTRRWNPDKQIFEPDALTASLGPDEKMRLHGTASSTIRDLHGDTILISALEDMEKAANQGLTIFGNHSYDVPEDVYGHVEHAMIKQGGAVDADGNPIYDLAFDVIINDENERAVKTWKAINKKSRLGMSIGANIPPGGAVRDKKSGALTIGHVELLETSIVGIPANPRSWIENAVKAFSKSQTTVPLGSPQLTLDTDAGTYRVEGKLDELAPGSVLQLGSYTASDETEISFGIGSTLEPAELGEEVLIEGVCPTCGKAKNADCPDAYHKDIEPDVTDAKITVIEVDTGDDRSQQDAPQSEPSSESDSEEVLEDATAPADVVAEAETVIDRDFLEPHVVTIFSQLIDSNKLLVRELELAKAAERDALDAKAAAEADRDTVASMTVQIVGGTKAILDKLADQPVGRRAVFHEVEQEFDALEGIYSRDFLNLLRSKNT